MSIDVNVQNDLVIVTESSEDITVNVSNAAGPAGANGVGVPTGGSTGQVLKKLTNTDYDTYWALDGGGVPYSGATGDVNLGEFQLRAGQLTLDTSPTGTAVVGTTRWNDTIGSSETTLKGGSVVLKNGVDLVARIVNKVTPNATLTKAAYQAVRVSGAQGQRLAVAYAQANNDANSADTIGLVCETIPTNQEGFIMTMGQLENINTTGSLQGETWVDGDVLYLSPTTPGAITKVKPTGAGHIVVIGYVEYAHVNNGKIYVKVMNGWELTELHDTDIVSPANNEALIYESSTALWKNKTIATALGYTPISGSGVAGQVAYWNGTNSQTGSNNLFWDAANSVLGVGTNTPNTASVLHSNKSQNTLTSIFVTNNNAGTAAHVGFRAGLDPSNFATDYISLFILGANFTTSGLLKAKTGVVENFGSNLIISNYNNTEPISFTTGTSRVEKVRIIAASGNVILQNGGTFTDGGQRLQVYGDAFVRGSGATSATSALLVQNSASTEIFRIYNDGTSQTRTAFFIGTDTNHLRLTNNGGGTNAKIISGFWNTSTTNGIDIQTNTTTQSGVGNGYGVRITNLFNADYTTGAYNELNIGTPYIPTSGTGTYTYLRLGTTINQTGGANGITRGLYVNPTLTAAADWRSIEWSNNTGWGLYGAGTANNYLGGSLGIGTNTIPANTRVIISENFTAGSSIGLRVRGVGSSTAIWKGRVVAGGDNVAFLMGEYNSQAWLGGHNAALDAWAPLYINPDGTTDLYLGNTGVSASNPILTIRNSTGNITTNGNLGLRSTIPTTLSSTNAFAFIGNGGAISSATSVNDLGLSNNGYFNGINNIYKNGGIASSIFLNSNGNIDFYNAPSGIAGGIITYTQRMTLTAAGRLLLGTTSESTFLLDVNGTARVSGVMTISGLITAPSGLFASGVLDIYSDGSNGAIAMRTLTNTLCLRKYVKVLGDDGGFGNNNASAAFQIDGTNRGFLPPRMTTTQKNAIASPTAGLIVYDTTLNKLCVYTTAWETITSI